MGKWIGGPECTDEQFLKKMKKTFKETLDSMNESRFRSSVDEPLTFSSFVELLDDSDCNTFFESAIKKVCRRRRQRATTRPAAAVRRGRYPTIYMSRTRAEDLDQSLAESLTAFLRSGNRGELPTATLVQRVRDPSGLSDLAAETRAAAREAWREARQREGREGSRAAVAIASASRRIRGLEVGRNRSPNLNPSRIPRPGAVIVASTRNARAVTDALLAAAARNTAVSRTNTTDNTNNNNNNTASSNDGSSSNNSTQNDNNRAQNNNNNNNSNTNNNNNNNEAGPAEDGGGESQLDAYEWTVLPG
eukprot:m.287591 g.287591  ORF g.287591 m.287591 type:complete len:305 (-) comp16362_c1_seq26:102-1016(-)